MMALDVTKVITIHSDEDMNVLETDLCRKLLKTANTIFDTTFQNVTYHKGFLSCLYNVYING